MPGAEKIIERNIRKCLKEREYLSYKIHVGQYGPEGFPDLLAVKNGVTSYFEIKQPGKEPTPIQLFRLRELRQAGCVARPVWSCADVIRILKEGI
jgi:Holliday junction resolvase